MFYSLTKSCHQKIILDVFHNLCFFICVSFKGGRKCVSLKIADGVTYKRKIVQKKSKNLTGFKYNSLVLFKTAIKCCQKWIKEKVYRFKYM